MAGLKRILKSHGQLQVNHVLYVWDYANNVGVKESEMPTGSDRWKASEKAKWDAVRAALKLTPEQQP